MKSIIGASAIIAIGLGAVISPAASAHDAHAGDSAVHAKAGSLSPEAKAFLVENEAAMDRMMAAMHQPPTGDVDKDFVSMMIAHHQSAIEMAQAVLKSSRNEAIRRLAQEIIITQQDEIRAMRMAVEPRAERPALSGIPSGERK